MHNNTTMFSYINAEKLSLFTPSDFKWEAYNKAPNATPKGAVPRMFAKAIKMIKINEIETKTCIYFNDSHLFLPICFYDPSRSITLIICLIVIAIVAGYRV